MTVSPISDRRLSHLEGDQVHFWARATDKSRRQVLEKLPAIEFVRRWSLHILPKGFTKTRCYGGWSNAQRKAFTLAIQRLAPVVEARCETLASASEALQERSEEAAFRCPKCQLPMALTCLEPRPSWREIFGNFASGLPEKKRRDTG